MMHGVSGIHHIGISVPDIQAAHDFYCGVLGFELAANYDFEPSDRGDLILKLENAAAKSIMIKAGNIYLEIFEFLSPEPEARQTERPVCNHGFTHIAFEVDDIEPVYQRLQEAGVEWHCPIQEYKDEDDWFQNAYGRDPFGNVIEVQQINRSSSWGINELARWKKLEDTRSDN